jgi:hypothetical protein
MSLDKLKRFNGLADDEKEYIGEFVNVESFTQLRLTFYSDILLEVSIVFSPDSFSDAIVNTYKSNGSWQTLRLDIVLPYCKLVVRRISEASNRVLCVNVLARKTLDLHKEEPKKEVEEEQHEHLETEKRSKSPFRSILKRKESRGSNTMNNNNNNSNKICVYDSRLPQFVPKNAILIGGYTGGNVVFIPPPTSDKYCILAYNNGQYAWVDMEIEADHKNVSWKI